MYLPLLTALGLLAAGPAGTSEDLLRASLQQQYPQVTRWAIEPLKSPAPPKDAGARIVALGARSAVRVQGHLYWYAVAGFAQVVSAAHEVASGQSVEADEGVMQERDVVGAGCPPLTSLAALAGTRARRSLHPGDIICASSIEPRPLVARGDEVIVRYVGSRILLTLKGVAQSDAKAGESLLVRNPGTRDLFRAVASGPGEVTLHE